MKINETKNNLQFGHGGDIYRNPVDYDFSVNLNPLGMPLGSIAAAHEAVALTGRYPDAQCEKLCHAICAHHGLTTEQILPGNGAAELIYAVCHGLKPKKILVAGPTFSEYERAGLAVGAKIVHGLLSKEDEFAMTGAWIENIDEETDLVFLCNPNNPTGVIQSADTMRQILARCIEMNAILCVDECFLPFLKEETAYSFLTKENRESIPGYEGHLLVLRAFTKIYAMAGLRLGYLVTFQESLYQKLREQLQPWNVSTIAQHAGIAALLDREYLEKTYDWLWMERQYLIKNLSQFVKKVYPSVANFLLVEADENFAERLLEDGFLIRSCENFYGLGVGYYRLAVRSHSENQALIRTLERWRV